ncbi:MAG: 3'(2'), 5'-bisphosphate nucleotidase [Salibacteraceae bacterium]|jgi:3'(2'), 5'-bisphosphate nucleotidase
MKGILEKWFAVEAALKGGIAIMEVYSQEDFGIELKEDESPLTLADKASHNEIVKILEAESEFPIISEEEGLPTYAERSTWDTYWLIDPLDGTKEFIKRNGEFTVNIALIQNGVPIFGVIYVPVSKTLYFGDTKDGAYTWESFEDFVTFDAAKSVRLPIKNTQRPFTMVGSRSHMSEETMAYMKEMELKHGEVEIISCGSSLKLCMVAEGSADAYPRFAPTMEWDTGAGDAICRAAGFSVTQYPAETPVVYNKENLLNPWFLVS